MEKAPDGQMVPAYANLWVPSLCFVGLVLVLLYKLSFKQESKTDTAHTLSDKNR